MLFFFGCKGIQSTAHEQMYEESFFTYYKNTTSRKSLHFIGMHCPKSIRTLEPSFSELHRQKNIPITGIAKRKKLSFQSLICYLITIIFFDTDCTLALICATYAPGGSDEVLILFSEDSSTLCPERLYRTNESNLPST